MLSEHTTLLCKIESLVVHGHIYEKDYLDIAMMLKEHWEQKLRQRRLDGSIGIDAERVERIDAVTQMMADAEVALTEGIRREVQRERSLSLM